MAPPINLEKIVEKLSVDYIVKKKADSILEYLQKTIASTSGDDFDFSDNLSSRLAIQKRMLSITGRDCRLVICELSSVCYSTDFLKHIRKDQDNQNYVERETLYQNFSHVPPKTNISLINTAQLVCDEQINEKFVWDVTIADKMYTEYSKIKGWYRLISIAVIEGNIGSGKSTILSELQARGHEVALEPLHIWDCPEESNLHSNVICLEDYNGKRCSLLKATYSWLRNRDPNRKGIRLLNLIKTQIMFNVSLLSIQIDTLTSVLTKTFGENFHLQTQRPFASEKKLVFFERSAYTVRELFLPNMVSAWDELNGVEQQLCAGPLKLLYDLVDICVAFFGMQFNYIQTDTVPPEDLLLRIKTRSRLTGTDSQNDITPEYLVDLERRLTDLPKKFEHDRQIFFKLIKDGH